MLDVRRLQVLRAVVTGGSVSAAATELGFTPSAISQQLATLEREAGLPLLEKSGRGVRPTLVGSMLADRAKGILDGLADIEHELSDLRAGSTGLIRIRYFATAGVGLVPPAVAAFRQQNPDVRLELWLDDADPLADLRAGRADIALAVRNSSTVEEDSLRYLPLLDDPYRLVLPKGHRLASRRTIDMAELAQEQWVDPDRLHGPCREPVTVACAAAGFQPDYTVHTEDYATAQGLIAARLGIAIMPMIGLRTVHPGVVVRRLRKPEPTRSIMVVVRAAVAEQVVMQRMVAALKDAASA
ncbi:LysR family transcriptional regulator [Actinoalloteichus hymeniacidonis]|nr:LysR family transcriptional regulator [Actinoalloteichus hymeniacidonis]MBB5906194.1 DNA-binding transcriptional LysR family regulator [Actinoalloteichus hymeniacidonis]